MRVLLLVTALVAACAAAPEIEYEHEYYRGHRVLGVTPASDEQATALRALEQWPDMDFWTPKIAIGRKTVFRVTPQRLETVQHILKNGGMTYETIQEDLQEAVNREALDLALARGKRTVTKGASFDRFMRHGEIEAYMKELAAKYPSVVTLETLGLSTEGRSMSVARISLNGGKSPRAVFLDAGIHAREWIAPATAVYLMQQLAENSEENKALLDGLDWYIIPVLNPDGYEYSHTHQRLWRKNRSIKSSRWCPGCDLNRNFGFHWMENGASTNPCAETFAGASGFSEIESQNLRDYLLAGNKDKRFKMYLTLHSYGNYLLYPWGYTPDLPDDADELDRIAQEVNKAMVAAGSEDYTVGSSTNVLYAAAGGSDDWAKGVAGLEKSYTIELPGGGSYGFDIPASKIKTVVTQVFEGFKVFAKNAKTL